MGTNSMPIALATGKRDRITQDSVGLPSGWRSPWQALQWDPGNPMMGTDEHTGQSQIPEYKSLLESPVSRVGAEWAVCKPLSQDPGFHCLKFLVLQAVLRALSCERQTLKFALCLFFSMINFSTSLQMKITFYTHLALLTNSLKTPTAKAVFHYMYVCI